MDLNRTRAQLETTMTEEKQEVLAESDRLNYTRLMTLWNIPQAWTREPLMVNSMHLSAWGPTMAKAMLKWMDQVKWPPAANEAPEFSNIGITWIELVLSFCFEIGMYFPVKRQGPNGKERLVVMPDYATAAGFQVSLSDLAHWFSIFYKQVEQLTIGNLWPSYDRGLVSSAYHLGSHCYSYGFLVRPQIPWQEQVVSLLSTHLKRHPRTALTILPVINFNRCDSLRPDTLIRELDKGWLTMSKNVHEET